MSRIDYYITQSLLTSLIHLPFLQFLLSRQLKISPLLIHQLLMRPLLYNPPPFHVINHIRFLNCT